jgi:hypothetical protein
MAWRNESIGPAEVVFSWTRRLVWLPKAVAGITIAVGLAADGLGVPVATGEAVGVGTAVGEPPEPPPEPAVPGVVPAVPPVVT